MIGAERLRNIVGGPSRSRLNRENLEKGLDARTSPRE